METELTLIETPSEALLEEECRNVFRTLFVETAANLRVAARAARAEALILSDGMSEAQVAIYAVLDEDVNLSTAEVHRRSGCARDTIVKWRHRYLEERGLPAPCKGPRPKHSSTTSPQETT
jgi:hypothetical protein